MRWAQTERLDSSRDDLSWRCRSFLLRKPLSEPNVLPTGRLHQGLPHSIHKVVLNQQVPEAIGSLVEVRHSEVERHGPPIFWSAVPDRRMREQALIDPGIALFEFFPRHVLGLKDSMAGVIERPVAMQDAALGFHLPEQRGRRIGREDVKRGALQAILLNPVGGARKDILAIVIEAQNK